MLPRLRPKRISLCGRVIACEHRIWTKQFHASPPLTRKPKRAPSTSRMRQTGIKEWVLKTDEERAKDWECITSMIPVEVLHVASKEGSINVSGKEAVRMVRNFVSMTFGMDHTDASEENMAQKLSRGRPQHLSPFISYDSAKSKKPF